MERIWDKYPNRKDPAVMAKLLENISPLVNKDGVPHTISPIDSFNVAFTWDPVFVKPFDLWTETQEITTYHAWGYYAFFKPSIAECVAQIPEKVLPFVTGFLIINQPQTREDLLNNWSIVEEGYHVATTRLYLKR